MPTKSSNIAYIFLLIALLGYVLPWIITPTAPLSLNAYDLAEWVSLHPSQPNTTPPMLVPLMLRVQLTIITFLVGLFANTYFQRWGALIVIALLSLAQLPPLEFLTIATDNINYQQQFILALVSLLIGGGLVIVKPKRWIPFIAIFLLIVGIISSVSGLQQAQQLYLMSLQENTLGSGIVITVCAYVMLILIKGRGIFKMPITLRDDTPSEIKQGSL